MTARTRRTAATAARKKYTSIAPLPSFLPSLSVTRRRQRFLREIKVICCAGCISSSRNSRRCPRDAPCPCACARRAVGRRLPPCRPSSATAALITDISPLPPPDRLLRAGGRGRRASGHGPSEGRSVSLFPVEEGTEGRAKSSIQYLESESEACCIRFL